MRLLCLLALTPLLAACAAPGNTPLRPDFSLQSSTIRWVRTASSEAADATCRRLNIKATGRDFSYPSGSIGGCATFDRSTASCTIYAPKPVAVEDYQAMMVLGHETLHCFEGYFHN